MIHKYFYLLIIALIANGCVFNCASYLNKYIKPLSIDGIVVSKQKAEIGCFGIIIYKSQDKLDTLKDLNYCVIESQGLWKFVEPGDSIFKARESLIVDVYRKGNVKKFDYPCSSR